jgi:glycerol-3-phosphate acyltransferase PlsY
MATAAFILIAYLIGSLSFAVRVSRLSGLPDPRTYGSGNPGATNVLRTGRKAAALVTLAGDGGKGWLAVVLAQRFGADYGVDANGIAACAVAVFVGHLFPLFFGFKGGKGVATALGILLAINVWLGLASLATWSVIAAIFRYVSLASLVAAVFAPLYAFFLFGASAALPAVILMSALLVWRHRSNVLRLAAGKESRIGERQDPESKNQDQGNV